MRSGGEIYRRIVLSPRPVAVALIIKRAADNRAVHANKCGIARAIGGAYTHPDGVGARSVNDEVIAKIVSRGPVTIGGTVIVSSHIAATYIATD